MNEKIKELAEVAGYYIDFDRNGGIVFKKTPGDKGDLELFAKLIIKECAKVANSYDNIGWCSDKIKEHFGVDE